MDETPDVKVSSLERFFHNLPDKELVIVEFLRDLVFECIPQCDERLSYQVPYYYGKNRICYIWPASVPMSGVDEGVVLGFCKGYELDDQIDFLDLGSRKEVSSRIFYTLQQVLDERDFVKTYLLEAAKFDTL